MGYRASFNTETFTPKELFAGDAKVVTELGTIASGQNLVAGSVLGKITASGKYVLSLAASTDGSQVPSAILSDDIDASAADGQEIVYLSGEFISSNLTFGTGHTAAEAKAALRDLNIYLK